MNFTRAAVMVLLFAPAWPAGAADILHFPKSSVAAGQPGGVPQACLEWTDGCRVCARSPGGAAACSNIGIACLPQKLRCTRK